MEIEVRQEHLGFDLYGVSGEVTAHDFAGTGHRLMQKLDAIAVERGVVRRGMYWVYDSATHMAVCCEVHGSEGLDALEHIRVDLERYIYFRHQGPYDQLGDVHRSLEREMAARGLAEIGPRVEKYGEWNADPALLVTEIFIGIR